MVSGEVRREADVIMAEIFGGVKTSMTEDGQQVTIFHIPAFSAGNARRRARANIRLKRLQNADVESVDEIGSGQIPGQSVYEVTVISSR